MADTEKVDDLKLRFSWGQTGSTNIDDFVYRQFYEKGNPIIMYSVGFVRKVGGSIGRVECRQ